MKIQLTFALLICFALFSHANEVSSISQQQLLSLQHAAKAPDYIVLDVRSDEEFKAGHIKGALNISHDTIEQHLDKLSGYQDKTVIVLLLCFLLLSYPCIAKTLNLVSCFDVFRQSSKEL